MFSGKRDGIKGTRSVRSHWADFDFSFQLSSKALWGNSNALCKIWIDSKFLSTSIRLVPFIFPRIRACLMQMRLLILLQNRP